ncbi:MAG: 30S ribosomal protein S24e [Candidatus Thorarchaeota archaeon]|nr:30S ribosomal protein S24e [Candidatus Thorarchaeota archaeon]
MKIDILREFENKLLQRKEIDFRIEHVGSTTPSRTDVKAKVVAQLNSDPACVVITRLGSKYGIGMTRGSARIYSTPEQLRLIEHAHILKRHEPKKKKKEEEA